MSMKSLIAYSLIEYQVLIGKHAVTRGTLRRNNAFLRQRNSETRVRSIPFRFLEGCSGVALRSIP